MKETVYVCDRCKQKGREGFTAPVRFVYDRNWDGVENSDSAVLADLCSGCACSTLGEFQKDAGHAKVTEYIKGQAWLTKLAGKEL